MGKVYTLQKGKVSRKDDIYLRRCGNHDISVRRREGFQYTRSEEQREMRSSFGARCVRAAAWRKANCDPPTPEYKRLLRRYKRLHAKNQTRYTTFWNYIVANV